MIIHNKILSKIIKQKYTLQDIKNISLLLQSKDTFLFPALNNGLFSASILKEEMEYTGYTNVWIRDNIHIAHARNVVGDTVVAVKNVNTLITYFRKHQQRFIDIIEAKANPQNPMNRPHIRFNGKSLEEIDQKWAHAQNDALGYFLWLYCKLANQGILIPKQEDMEVLALFPSYFQAIHYWEDEDSGHWEEMRKIGASSIGVVSAGFKELSKLLKKLPDSLTCKYKNKPIPSQFVDELAQKGTTAMYAILPSECIQDDPLKKRRYDASLLFLIYPLQIIENEEIVEQILSDVVNNLQGDYGIRRYLGDSYWAPNYKKKMSPAMRTIDFSEDMATRNALLSEKGKEAQWCIFDPIVSIIYGIKFRKTFQEEYLNKQIEYLNRSLGQITEGEKNIPGFKCPELYYIENGQYLSNDHVPLLWTQANLMMALKGIQHSLVAVE